ncbi:MAG: hypothetical protein U0414_24495 [Polyangiaceae bacterium]
MFAIELCMRLEPGSEVRARLADLVAHHPQATDPGAKWSMLDECARVLIQHKDLYVRGCWDFFDTNAKALSDYDMWCKGMITREGSRTSPSGSVDPYRPEPRFMTFTIALLLQRGDSGERSLSSFCEVPEHLLWKRATFVRILAGLKCVNFAYVKSDVFYLIPGEESWGLTSQDLQHTKFEYLRLIED